MVLIDLEKTYDWVLRKPMCWVLEKKQIRKYIKVIKNIYIGVVTSE